MDQTNRKQWEIVLPAYAKINTYLAITGRRQDGYHTLCSHMQGVTLCDTVSLRTSGKASVMPEVKITCDNADVPLDESNLIYRAAQAFFAAYRVMGREPVAQVGVHLKKKIPLAAGLAGGSADAAATLRGLNEISGRPFDDTALCAIGVRVGADVPFCLRSVEGAMTARGIGDVLECAPPLPDVFSLVIACDGEGVFTPWAYGQWDRNCRANAREESEAYDAFLRALERKNVAEIAACSFNSFESVVMETRPAISALMQRMRERGAAFCRMSGSGPSVVGFFENVSAAECCRDVLVSEGITAHLCRPLIGGTGVPPT